MVHARDVDCGLGNSNFVAFQILLIRARINTKVLRRRNDSIGQEHPPLIHPARFYRCCYFRSDQSIFVGK